MERLDRLTAIVDRTEAELDKEGATYVISVVDRQPKKQNGGNVITCTKFNSNDLVNILDSMCPTRKELVQMAVCIGTMLKERKATVKPRNKQLKITKQ